jgi:hypothetical protein
MRVKIYRQFGALNSRPVFDSLAAGLTRLGHKIVDDREDLAVIWSVLWSGRMQNNAKVYSTCKEKNIPVMIAEVGNLKRNVTWRLSLDNINGDGKFANTADIDPNRPAHLGLSLKDIKIDRKPHLLIACQHQRSLQWGKLPNTETWVKNKITEIRKYTDRKIIVRPHPRNLFSLAMKDVILQYPKKIISTYDNFDIDYDAHAVINHNSGPAVQSAIEGTPVICDKSSLAYEVSDSIENIENIKLRDRESWFLKLCHTEWTLDEISTGNPVAKLLVHLG